MTFYIARRRINTKYQFLTEVIQKHSHLLDAAIQSQTSISGKNQVIWTSSMRLELFSIRSIPVKVEKESKKGISFAMCRDKKVPQRPLYGTQVGH